MRLVPSASTGPTPMKIDDEADDQQGSPPTGVDLGEQQVADGADGQSDRR